MEQASLANWVYVLRRRWLTVAIATFAVMASAVLAGLWLLPRVYVAEVSLRIPTGQPRLSGLAQYLAGGFPGLGLEGAPGADYIPILQSLTLAQRVESRLGLKDFYREKNTRAAAEKLQKSVTAEEHESVLYLRVQTGGTVRGFSRPGAMMDELGQAVGPDVQTREMAARIANTYAEELQRYLQEENVTAQGRTLAFVREELAKARVEYEQAGRALQDFQEQHGTVALTERTRALVDVAAQLGRDERMARATLAEASGTLQKARERQVAVGRSPGLELPPSSPRLEKLYDEYVTNQTELALKRQELTEQHGEVQALRAELAQLDRRIKEEKARIKLGASEQLDPHIVELAVNKAGAEARARSLSAAVASLRAQLGPVPGLARQLAELELDVQIKQGLLEILTKEEAQAAIEERREGTWAQVLDPAIVPDRPTSPRLKLILALAFVVGLMLSTSWAFAAEALVTARKPQVALGHEDEPA